MDLRRLLPLAALVLVPACAPAANEEDVAGGEEAFTEADAACFDAASENGESATDARARCLTTQASALLDAQIARNEDPHDAALEAFKGKLRVPAETGCWTEDVSGHFTGLWQNDIDSKRDVGQLAVQLKSAVEFLKFYYRDLDGYPNHLFDTIEICPNGQVGGDLRIVGSRLRIGVRSGWGGRLGIHTSNAVRDLWTQGEHLEGNAALDKLSGIRWSVADPVGTPRTVLRKALRGIIAKLQTRLGGLGAKPEEALRTELTRLVREETTATAKDEQGRSIRERALAKIAAMSGDALADFAEQWQLEVEKTDLAEGAEDGAVMMSDVLSQKDVQVNVTQTGLVNVQNVHQIEVSMEAFLPSASNFTRYVEATKTETKITVKQFGIVNVQTNDLINVRVQVLFQNTAQTATLDRVLGP